MEFSIDGTPAIYLENGILLLNITIASGMIADEDNQNRPYCQILGNLRFRGLFTCIIAAVMMRSVLILTQIIPNIHIQHMDEPERRRWKSALVFLSDL
jgi:hypothetical protein